MVQGLALVLGLAICVFCFCSLLGLAKLAASSWFLGVVWVLVLGLALWLGLALVRGLAIPVVASGLDMVLVLADAFAGSCGLICWFGLAMGLAMHLGLVLGLALGLGLTLVGGLAIPVFASDLVLVLANAFFVSSGSVYWFGLAMGLALCLGLALVLGLVLWAGLAILLVASGLALACGLALLVGVVN